MSDEGDRFIDTLGKIDELPATDDVLARVMPLLEQVAAIHDGGRVAPLESVEAVRSVAGRLAFASALAVPPRIADAVAIWAAERRGAVRVAGRFRRDGDGVADLSIGELDTPSARPVFLPRYVAWEHSHGHHDPLTDIFSLGMIAASCALDVDLGDPVALARFVEHRRNLVALNPRLAPAVARVIAGMTELDRRERLQDLASIIAALRGYREQRIELEVPAAEMSRREAIFRRLRDRLFDFSRRNRLLHFKPTGSTVDLTAASVPLVLDVRNIDAATLFTSRGKAADELLAQKPIPLARYVRFEDYPFVAPALDALRLEARRSRAELGFSQLRIVVCFLHWHDLKEAPDERIASPLLLLPVELDKKRGVRDAFTLHATDDRAEVNPVLRHYLKQRYSIELPELVDLGEPGALDRLHALLVSQIQATEPGVSLEKLDQPRIDLVIAVARKRLDAYRRKVRLSGRHVKSRLGLDYAYLGDTIRPLGVQLFHAFVQPHQAPDAVMHGPPRPIVWKAAATDESITKELYSLKNAAQDGGPYRWAFDLTSVTLAHFNYRKVSLVRDYTALVEQDDRAPNPAFAAIFRDDARPIDDAPPPLPLAERHEVVLADPTQASAVARVRGGGSYVIQGPPGTGKSQTIANLIADCVARGQRVLFVCEKRAALDVVHHRLVQVGMGALATLIHDAQDDKKAFIEDLKETYEAWVAAGPAQTARDERAAKLARMTDLGERGDRFARALSSPPDDSDVALLALMRRAIELRAQPELDDAIALPAHRATATALPALARVEASLRALGHAGPLAGHPARLLGETAAISLDDLRANLTGLSRALVTIAACPPLAGDRGVLAEVIARHRFARRADPLVTAGLGALVDPASELAKRLRDARALVAERTRAFAATESEARGWRDPLAADDAGRALVLAKRYEAGVVARLVRWLSPGWWRLRGLLVARFDVASRAVLGDWTGILEGLLANHRARTALADADAAVARELAGLDPREAGALIDELQRPESIAPAVRALRDAIARGEARAAVDVARDTADVERGLAILRGYDHLEVAALRDELDRLVKDALAIAPLRGPLGELDRANAEIAALVRRHPIDGPTLEAAVVRRAIATTQRVRAPDLALVEGSADAFGTALGVAADALRAANATALCEAVRSRFAERALLATAPAASLTTAEAKEHKRLYSAGRKELEHELGKVMRHKTIREIVSGPAGPVVRDLKPIWLMSPLGVADVLPLEAAFDLVIFDEASQIPLEDAVPSIHRASQCIVVGDRQQLPPTNFFAAALDDADPSDAEAHALDGIEAELDADSLLAHADRTLPSTLLGWHYRSRDEVLIDFSNRTFYAGNLLTVPSVAEARRRPPIVAARAEDGALGADRMLERPISFHRIDGAIYESRRNVAEARYIAHLVRAFLAKQTGKTIGVVAFSEAQQGAIESALDELCETDPEFRVRLDEEMTREEDNQHVGLFIKNLENVQGDERDVIVVSVCYGPDPRGRMIMNFGPINRRGGERRLNVIFSRAKHHVALVTTIGHERITNDYNDGAACLKTYLRYAEAASIGDSAAARAALATTASRSATPTASDPVVAELATRLRAAGWEVAEAVGVSRLRCDLAIKKRGEARYALGILVDRPERVARGLDEVLRIEPSVLRAFGWTITTVLTRDWLADPDGVVRAIAAAIPSTGD